jgi:hypothetical protein
MKATVGFCGVKFRKSRQPAGVPSPPISAGLGKQHKPHRPGSSSTETRHRPDYGLILASDSRPRGGAARATVTGDKRGGSFRVGIPGGSAKDTIDGNKLVSSIDGARIKDLYDRLWISDPQFAVQSQLAVEAEPNSKADVWTVRLQDGVEFHTARRCRRMI